MKYTRLLIVLLVAAHLFLTGCAAPLFLAAAGGAGYLATQEEPRQEFEKFLQDLDKSIKQTTRKITGEQQAEEVAKDQPNEAITNGQPVGKIASEKKPVRKQLNNQPQTGLIFTIQKASISPAKVKSGEEVKFVLRFVILGAPATGLKVIGKSTLSVDGKELTVLKDESTTKENGTWENTLTFAVPDSAKPGKYTIIHELSAQGVTRRSQRSFTVL